MNDRVLITSGTVKNVWLLFNYGSLIGHYHYRRDAYDEMRRSLGADFYRWPEFYDLVKGDVSVVCSKPIRTARGRIS